MIAIFAFSTMMKPTYPSEEKTLGEILPTINPKVAQGLPINMQQENVKTIKKLLFIMSVKKIINSFCCEA